MLGSGWHNKVFVVTGREIPPFAVEGYLKRTYQTSNQSVCCYYRFKAELQALVISEM
jgi:hypothetical protein